MQKKIEIDRSEVMRYLGYRTKKPDEKMLALIDECEEELNQILQMLQQAISQVAEMLSSATDTQTAIANNMGAMA